MTRATGRAKGNAAQQLLTAIDSLCSDPTWIAITDTVGADAEILVKRRRLIALRKRFTQTLPQDRHPREPQ